MNKVKHDKTLIIISVCSVCGKFLNVKDGKGISGLSHTYCRKCSKKVLATLTQ
jgi:DNA-directed RNA polymerase subunit RPC12/RpoP